MSNEILKRLSSETPAFFKGVIKISLTITALSGLVIGSGLVLPESIIGIIGQVGIVAGIVSASISKLTTIYGISENEEYVPKIETFADTLDGDTKTNPPKKAD